MISTIIFDNDGVLVDSEILFFEANRRVLAGEGIELTLEAFQDISLRRGKSCLELLVRQGKDEMYLSDLRRRRNVIYEELLTLATKERQGIYKVLESLKSLCRFGVVTNAQRRHFELMHRRTHILPYLSFVYTLEDSSSPKPDPAPYLLALQRQNLKADECLAIEDSERGVLSAAAAGLRCIAAPTPLTRSSNFASALEVIENLEEIPAIVEKLHS